MTREEHIQKLSVGQKVTGNWWGRTMNGIIRSVHTDGEVPGLTDKVTATDESPAARVELLDDEGEPRGQFVGRKLESLTVMKTGAESVLDSISDSPLRDSQKSAIMDGDMKSTDFNKTFEVIKAEGEQRIVYGWASVSTVKGELFVDSQGDIIEPDEMVKMANNFMLDVRTAKAMHDGAGIGEFIHSLPLTKELAAALGIETDREGWIVAAKIHDDAIWQKVRSGEMTGFSIGGKSQRREAVE